MEKKSSNASIRCGAVEAIKRGAMKKAMMVWVLLCSILLTSCSFEIIGYGTSETVASLAPAPSASVQSTDPSKTTPAASVTTEAPDDPIPPITSESGNPPLASQVVGRIPASDSADPSWFDDACFIGDSISIMLRNYSLTGALGDADFFVTTNYSTVNALRPLSDGGPHPTYQGVKMLPEDCVKASGARKVFLMLGMNDLTYKMDSTLVRYQTLIERILEKSPDAEIFIQSVTPLVSNSVKITEERNNNTVKVFNQRLEALCEENGWFYLDIASVLYDDAGEALRPEYCGDIPDNGIHLTQKGVIRWVEYLLTHTVDFEED